MKYLYDIKGQLLEVIDPLDRMCFAHKYDTAGNNLWTEHLDSGVKTMVYDAQGKPLFSTDAKGAFIFSIYDSLHRVIMVWTRDSESEEYFNRQVLQYGDTAVIDPEALNLKGKLYLHQDEAGQATMTAYDFKGNPLEKTRQVFADAELTGSEKFQVDWIAGTALLDPKEYVTTLQYDALNRVRKSTLPVDVDIERKVIIPTYNRAGALQAIELDDTTYVRHIAYNAKGQRVLLAMGNDMMTRYAYDPLNYRLLRIKTEKYEEDDFEYEPQSGTTKQDTAYDYDLGGNIITTKERLTDCGIDGTTLGDDALDRLFSYDPLKRLLEATGRESDTQSNTDLWEEKSIPGSPNANHTRAYTQGFDYDKVGNIQELTHTATGNSYSRHYHYTSGLNILEQIDDGAGPPAVDASFTYDEVGNQVQQNTERFFEWDAADQLRYFKIDAGGGPSVEAHYLYAGGQRIKKFVRDGSGNVEVTIYIDGVYEHRYKRDSGGDITDEQTQLHVMDGRSRIATLRLGDDFGDTTPATHYNLEDHLGTSTTRLTTTGTVIDREEYYPFGESSLRTFDKKRYRYVGKEKDGESGLYYYGARYYAAWTCRFISIDPLADKYAQLTPYNYAANDPIGDLDIDGNQSTQTQEGPSGGQGGGTQIGSRDGVATFLLSEFEVVGISPYAEGHAVTNTLTTYSTDSRGIPHEQSITETKIWHIGDTNPLTGEERPGGWMTEDAYMTQVFEPLLNDYRTYNYGGTYTYGSTAIPIIEQHALDQQEALGRMASFVANRSSIASWMGPALSESAAALGPYETGRFEDWSGRVGYSGIIEDVLMAWRAIPEMFLRNAAASATARTFTSTDPLVADLANKIESLYPGHVVGVNVPLRNAAGNLLTDMDILLQNSVLQVKSGGSAQGLLRQLQRSEAATGLPSIGFGPNLPINSLRTLSRQGALVTGDEYLLLQVIKP